MKSIWTICSKYSLEVSMEMNSSALCALVIVLLAFDLKIISAAETGGNSTVPILPKAGQCPRLLNVVPSQKGCFCDEDCPGDDKCCVFDCGAVCVPPAFTKPGVCPRRRWGSGMCAEFCSNDSDCPNDEKCCHNGCGHECIAPYTGMIWSQSDRYTHSFLLHYSGNKKAGSCNVHTHRSIYFTYTLFRAETLN
uniref:WAP four-disulfide core domain 2 n=1 Tax=Oncorhynchus mykiss TaxID=8022 RepID=A0A8C7LZ36_ONCMY